tara:strand:- start:8770 stop:9321 length:552 start_codon:yes stop_codon:yes gene_type:complete
MSQEQKSKIRTHFFNKRLNFDSGFVKNESNKICQKAIEYLKSKKYAKNIAVYFSINNELKLDLLQEFLEQNNYQIFLPKITIKNLEFGTLSKENLINNPKIQKIIEPKNITDEIMDIVFCPLVSFDKNNNRIGMGGGLYDCLIEKYRKNNYKTKFIGIAYEEQFFDSLLPIEKFDQKLDLIIS